MLMHLVPSYLFIFIDALQYEFVLFFQPIDCAGYLGTDNRRDQCGVCRGDNSTCVKYQNTFWRRPRGNFASDGRKDRHYDYNEILTIPAGATRIVVSEASDTNFLVLVDSKNNFFINGNWRVQSPGRFLVHGSEFVYNRTWDGRENLSSDGPTRLPLTVQDVILLPAVFAPNSITTQKNSCVLIPEDLTIFGGMSSTTCDVHMSTQAPMQSPEHFSGLTCVLKDATYTVLRLPEHFHSQDHT
ncbi:ADAMTS-like protein 5 [Trichonephila inaurata madagascariensis]|uniref:ADAMTS-like protein 5 n=1 Tax=Trichonephila inaurata madagascariensis TaxID=2747483 RepID=A0A8X6YR15_9ARAC|nr:ADAMTS-like protein 5 [Trichonephila inaurata madagascariensis]